MQFILCIIAFAINPNVSHARLVDKTTALVNADLVLYSDIEKIKSEFSLRREIDPLVNLTGFTPEKDSLDYLIQERLALQKFPASEEEVEEEINAVQKNNKIERDKLKEILAAQGVKFDDYRGLMKVSVSKRKLIERELRPLAIITDEDVKNFYYTDPTYREKKREQKLALTYVLQQMLITTESVANEAKKKLKNGEDFDSVASELAGKGIEVTKLGAMAEENLSPKIKESIVNLKVGEATAPISTGTGYMILRILEIGAPRDPDFEKEKDQIKNNLFHTALLKQLKSWTEKERAQSYIHIP